MWHGLENVLLCIKKESDALPWFFLLFNMKSCIISVSQILHMNKVMSKCSSFYSMRAANWLSLFCRFRNKLVFQQREPEDGEMSTWSVAQIRLNGIFTSSRWPLTCIFVYLGRESWGLQIHQLLKKVMVKEKSARTFLNILKGVV